MDASVVIKNEFLEARMLFYGATLQKLIYKGVNVVLGYEHETEYRKNGGYVGATVGRYANRISNGRFSLGGKEYNVGCNEPDRGHLHGGSVGMDKRIFTPVSVTRTSVTLGVELRDGEEGYPGGMSVRVTYSLVGPTLSVVYDADTDADTIFNPTNHSYFNLSGGGTILDHELTVDADSYLPVDTKMIPLPSPVCVSGTAFDFRMPKAIGKDICSDDEQIKLCGGYDHNFILNGKAVLHSPVTDIIMVLDTDMSGLQVYTGNFLQETGGGFARNAGVALETQFFPDSPNRPDFPSPLMKKGEHFRSETRYTFDG